MTLSKNKENIITNNCDIWIGESNNIVVYLPDGVKPTKEAPVIVTVVDHNGNAQAAVTVIVLGDADFIEKGKTDIYGRVTLPITNEGYTDENGKVNVDNLNVIVNDELGLIANAFVVHNDDGTITVTLPSEKSISYDNRITVAVLDSQGTPISEISVTVNDVAEKTFTAATDENAPVKDMIVTVSDTEKTETNLTDENGATTEIQSISVKLPENVLIDYANRVTVSVLNKADKTPVVGMSITVTDNAEKSATGITDKNGKIIVHHVNEDISDDSGKGDVTDKIPEKDTDGDGKTDTEQTTTAYFVTVNDTKGIITGSFIKAEDGKILVTLPDTNTLTTSNQTTVTVMDKGSKPVSNVSVTVTDKDRVTASEHKAYIFGYPNGEFLPDGDMTRAEAAAIFARLISKEKDKKISGTKTSFTDVSKMNGIYPIFHTLKSTI